jgi:dipeptidyl aminopeptidase/acylaminoacyl peptidase
MAGSAARDENRVSQKEIMQRDIRDSALFQEAEALFRALRQPGTGLISDAAEVSTNGAHAVFSGTIVDVPKGTPPTRICLTELATGDTRVLTFGPNIDRLPKFSPDGKRIAFLSDRGKQGDFQLYLLDPASGAARPTPAVDGWVEYLHWSPDGKRILLGVAGHGADVAGGQGAVTSKQAADELPSWMPNVETGDESFRWRRAWVYDLATGRVRKVNADEINIWEVVWCGNGAIAAVVSPGPGEGLWYSATLEIVDIETGKRKPIYTPKDQLGWPAASPSGKHLAVVEAACSDRWIVAGDLRVIDTASGKLKRVETQGVDITHAHWRSDRRLLLGGHRGFETVVGLYDVDSKSFSIVWRSDEMTTGGRYITVSGLNESGDCVLLGENFITAPELALIRAGKYQAIRSFDVGEAYRMRAIEAIEQLTWKASDGLEIQGWLLRPKGEGPHPLVMSVHGGPIAHYRQTWLGRGTEGLVRLTLLNHGSAVFLPNPRGSSGRGQDYARHVIGDMGGVETYDYLAGIDHLVERGIADPKRLGVTGGSYGGFMTSWLITQDSRFAAAVPYAPTSNQVTQRLISNIPNFVDLFLADRYNNPTGKYFERSPIMHAHKVRTPTLNICGALDRCTPPAEAIQFHNALLENGVKSILVAYPEEGHGVRKFPAAIDFTARTVAWFEEHMAPGVQTSVGAGGRAPGRGGAKRTKVG